MEQKLDAATLKNELFEKQLRRCEDEKIELREQLVAADAELFMHHKTLAQAPKLRDEVRSLTERVGVVRLVGSSVVTILTIFLSLRCVNQILEALKESCQCRQLTPFIEDRLGKIHNTLEDMRHASGERTETDDSPQKKDWYVVCICAYVC